MNNKSLLAVAMVCATVIVATLFRPEPALAHDADEDSDQRFVLSYITRAGIDYWQLFDTERGQIYTRRYMDNNAEWINWGAPAFEGARRPSHRPSEPATQE